MVNNADYATGVEMKTLHGQRGVWSLDFGITVVAALSMGVYFMSKFGPINDKANESVMVEQVVELADGARDYKNGVSDGYTSITMTLLSTNSKYVNSNFGDGVGKNPYNGNYGTAVGGTPNDLDITITGLPAPVCEKFAARMNQWTSTACSTGTVTVSTT